jgi:hypothetical protein
MSDVVLHYVTGDFIMSRLLPLLFSFTALSCAGAPDTLETPATYVGTVVVIGNEPFTKLALQTAEGKILQLSCDGDAEKLLRGSQGKLVRLHVDKQEQVARETQLHVKKAEVLPQQ